MSDSIFNEKVIQMRIVQLEYKFPEMTDDEIIKEIEMIYLEETGEPMEKKIDIEQMREPEGDSNYATDAKASAIIVSSKENKDDEVEEIIFISRGSVTTEDWIDNVFSNGVGTGGVGYAEDTVAYINKLKKRYGNDIPINALGHSKANNTLTTIQTSEQPFESVNTFNGAQDNVYQQVIGDTYFQLAVQGKFGNQDIRSIPPKELETFAVEYYKEKGVNINQTRSTSDFLYALDLMPGMFVVGNVEEYETDSEKAGFVQAVNAIPQEDLEVLSEFLAPFGEVYSENGVDGVMDAVKASAASLYFGLPDNERVDFESIDHSISSLVDGLNDSGYLSAEEAEQLTEDLQILTNSVEIIYNQAKYGLGVSPDRLISDTIITLGHYNFRMKGAIERIQESFEGVGEAAYEHHSLEALMNEVAEGRSYSNGEVYLELSEGPGGQVQISINLSKILDAYSAISEVLSNQDSMLETYQQFIDQKYTDYYDDKKNQLIQKMNDIESNYRAYQHLIPSENRGLIQGIRFHEQFESLTGAPIEGMAMIVRMNREKIESTAETMREGVELLFDKDHNVANMFKHLSG